MLAELEYDHREFSGNSPAPTNIAVRFFRMPVKNEAKSVDAGRPIYDDMEMVEKRIRGDRNNIVVKPVSDQERKDFRDAYKAFKEDTEVKESGTPLTEWPHVNASLREELRYFGFTTVEHLSEADDNACTRVPGLLGLKARAKAFLELSKGLAPLEKLQTALEAEKSKREALDAQVAELGKLLAEKGKK
jgi:hypothetical protein